MKKRSALVLLQRALQRLPFAPLDVNCMHCMEYVASAPAEPGLGDAGIAIRSGTALDIQRMAECQNFPERIPERFVAQEHCVVATIGDRVIGYQWFCDKPSRIEERYGYKIEIPPDSVYAYDAFVLPQFRRARVWTCFHAFYLKDLLAQLGRRRVIAMVDQGNTVSMKAHSRIGYRLYRKVYVAKIFRKSVCISKQVRRREDSFRSAAPPGATEHHPDPLGSALS